MSTIDETALFSINPEMSCIQVDDEAVLLGATDEALYGLNSLGMKIFEQLALQPMSVRTMSSYLTEHFDVDEAQCLEDTKRFFELLLAERIITQ